MVQVFTNVEDVGEVFGSAVHLARVEESKLEVQESTISSTLGGQPNASNLGPTKSS